MDVAFFFDPTYESNAFAHPFYDFAMVNLPILWLNSVNERSENSVIHLDELEFFTYRLDETIIHEYLHKTFSLDDEQITMASRWIRECVLYGE